MAPILSRTSGAGGSGGFGFGRKRNTGPTGPVGPGAIQSADSSGWSTPDWASGWSGSIFSGYAAANSFDSEVNTLTAFGSGGGAWSGSIPYAHSMFAWSFIRRSGSGPTQGLDDALTMDTLNWRAYQLNDNNSWWGRMLSGNQNMSSPLTAMELIENTGNGPDLRSLFSDGRIVVGSQSNYRVTVSDGSGFSVGNFVRTPDGSKYGYIYAKSGNQLDLWKTTGSFIAGVDLLEVPTTAQLFSGTGALFAFSGNNSTTDLTGNGNSLVSSNQDTNRRIWSSYTHSFRLNSTWATRVQLPTFTPSNSGWSIEFWVYPTNWSGKYLIHCGDGSLSWNVQETEMRFYNNFSSGIVTWTSSNSNDYLNMWNFVQIRYDGSETRFYFNGTERGSLSGNIGSMSQFVIGDKTQSDSFPIGGYIQDVVVYNGVSRAVQKVNDTPNTTNRTMTPFGLY